MNFPQEDIKLHNGNFAAMGQRLKLFLSNGVTSRLILES
ncbi:TPA: DNA base-flipping protein [Klebsiella variicola]|nr:DNA base-flipping protein [Klebsiella variicola]HBY0382801.1 DNA base-flipping protein [Klebsiella variicola]